MFKLYLSSTLHQRSQWPYQLAKAVFIHCLLIGFLANSSLANTPTSKKTVATLIVPTTYGTIQAAINAAIDGDVIQVAAGTYTEQLIIDNKDITIQGAGLGTTTIKAPASLAAGLPDEGAPYVKRNLIEIKGGSAVTITGFTIDGPFTPQDACGTDAFNIYVLDNSSLVLTNSSLTNAKLSDPSFFGCQVGFGIGVGLTGSPASLTVSNVTVSGYQKGGLLVRGSGSSLTADNLTVTGVGETTAIGQNGIQISAGAVATITSSTITNNSYTPPGGGTDYFASGILTYNSGPVSVSNSNISNNDAGFLASGTGNSTLNNNTFDNNTAGVYTEGDTGFPGDQFSGNIGGSGNTFSNNDTGISNNGTTSPNFTNSTFIGNDANSNFPCPQTSISNLATSGTLSPANCSVRLTATATGNSFVFTGPGGYVFSNAYRNVGTYPVFALDVKQPGTYTLTVSGCGTASTQTILVTGTPCN